MTVGWVVLVVAALAMVGTQPGRTQGLGLVTEPFYALAVVVALLATAAIVVRVPPGREVATS